jgi:hypothetical protein
MKKVFIANSATICGFDVKSAIDGAFIKCNFKLEEQAIKWINDNNYILTQIEEEIHYFKNIQNNWLLVEYRIFDSEDNIINACLQVYDIDNGKYIINEALHDDVYSYEWNLLLVIDLVVNL